MMEPALLARRASLLGLVRAKLWRYSRQVWGKWVTTSSSLSRVVEWGLAAHCIRNDEPCSRLLLNIISAPFNRKPAGEKALALAFLAGRPGGLSGLL